MKKRAKFFQMKNTQWKNENTGWMQNATNSGKIDRIMNMINTAPLQSK